MVARNHPDFNWHSYYFGFVTDFGNTQGGNLIIWSFFKAWPGSCLSLAQLRRLREESLSIR